MKKKLLAVVMAAAMVGEGTGYSNLAYTVALNSEEYGVGFRKDSDLTALLNQFFVDSYKSGKSVDLAETYKIQAALIKMGAQEKELPNETDK